MSYIKHGKSNTPEYRAWNALVYRCTNSNASHYHRYGGRGIAVCDRWINSFENFLEDMGERPLGNYSIERVDNDGDYTPENCIWATKEVQSKNTRTAKVTTFFGVRDTQNGWTRRWGASPKELQKILFYD